MRKPTYHNEEIRIQIIEFLAKTLAEYDQNNARDSLYEALKTLIENLAAGHAVALSDYYGVMAGTVPYMNDDLNMVMSQFVTTYTFRSFADEQE